MIRIEVCPAFKHSNMTLPEYAHPGDAGFDLQANIKEPLYLYQGEVKIVPTGLRIALPDIPEASWNWELQIRPRSGLAAKHGITVLNSPGTIDAGYRNEIGVILLNTQEKPFCIGPGDRIAQAVLAKAYKAQFELVESLDETQRGMGGFGSTGQ